MGLVITIGGLPGSGKSTLGKLLAARLGIPFYSMGGVRREYARDRGWTLAKLNEVAENDPESDRLVDEFQAKLPEKLKSFVIDSRLGYHFIPQALKLFMRAPVRVCAQRIMDRQSAEETWSSVEEGVRALTERVASDKRRYAALYGIDSLDESQYDIVLDSEHNDPEALVEVVLAELCRRGFAVPSVPPQQTLTKAI